MSVWTEENTKELLVLWEAGHSASLIAAKLGVTSRSAVLGKLHRIGAPKRPKPLYSKAGPVRRRTRNVRRRHGKIHTQSSNRLPRRHLPSVSVIKPRRFVGFGLAKTHNLKHNMCRWPYGDPVSDDFHYCGRQNADGKTYCADHFNISVRTRGGSLNQEKTS